jgi:putative SbcD/Mre11-related phosphoesterase
MNATGPAIDTPWPLINGWALTPEGAAVRVGSGAAVVADLHLGYEWARGRGGDMLPPHSRAETFTALERLLHRLPISRLIVAGDLVETPAPCPRTRRDVLALRSWLADRGVELVAIKGNHDGFAAPASLALDGWTIAHGDRPVASRPLMTGHLHPAFRAGHITTRCFLAGPDRIVLPAFTANAAGLDVATTPLPPSLKEGPPLRCYACVGEEVLDFGAVTTLGRRLRRLAGPSSSPR